MSRKQDKIGMALFGLYVVNLFILVLDSEFENRNGEGISSQLEQATSKLYKVAEYSTFFS